MNKCPTCGSVHEGDVCAACAAAFAMKATLSLPPQEDLPASAGTTFHGYEVVSLLGRGGMGTVYKARQPGLDRIVALKILPRNLAQDPEFRERFQREAKTLAALSHPHIVSVYEVGAEGDLLYIAMEFVDGRDLRQILRERRLPPDQSLRLVAQICDALQYAHGEGVVHRDIKPENILIDRKGRVKIADFGLAKLGDPTGSGTLTQTDVVMGTPVYMAPEQLENTKSVDHRADIYSLGVVFYEILTGELPVGRFDPPSQRAAVDARMDPIVLRALEKEPDRRYQSAAAVRTDVKRLAAPAPDRLHRRAVAVAVAVAAVAITLAWLAWPGRIETPAAPPAAAAPSKPAPTPDLPPLPIPKVEPRPQPVSPPAPATAAPAAPAPATPPRPDFNTLSPEDQIQRMAQQLKDLNPGFDGKEAHSIQDGKVTTLSFASEKLAEIAPLKALQGLRSLSLKGCPVADLAALRGLALERLDLEGTAVRDLSPLAGMPLATLLLRGSRVADLDPLRGMPLKEITADLDPRRDAPALRALSALERINGQEAVLFWRRHDPDPLGPVEPALDPARWENSIDLLALVHPEADAISGSWTRQGATVACAGGAEPKHHQIQMPFRPPEEYDLRVTFTRVAGNEGASVYLIGRGRPFYLQLGAWGNTVCGFGEVQGKLALDNPTGARREKWIENGRPYTAIIQVRKNGVRAFLGTELVSQWLTDYADVHWKSDLRDATLLGLEGCLSRVAWHEARLLEVSGRGEITCGASRLAQRPPAERAWEILVARRESLTGAPVKLEKRIGRSVKELTADGIALDDGSRAEPKELGPEALLALLKRAVPEPSPAHRKLLALLMAERAAFDAAYAELAAVRASGAGTRLEAAFVLAREARQVAPGSSREQRVAGLIALLKRRAAALAEVAWSDQAWAALQALVPQDARELDGHFYMLVPEQVDFLEAKRRCEEMGGHLATISSPGENLFVGRLATAGFAWIGLCDGIHEGQWQWVTGEPVDFTSWAPGQPNDNQVPGAQDYVTTQPDGNWCDLPNAARYFICEWDAPRPTDLQPLMSPQLNALDGGWVPEGAAIVSFDSFARARYIFPILAPQEYDLRIVAEGERGSDKLGIVLSSHMAQTVVVINDEPSRGYTSWLGTAGAKDAATSRVRKAGRVPLSGGPHTIVCRVRKNGLRVTVDERPVIEWKGEWSKLAVPPGMENDNICCSSVCTWGGRFRISTVELTPALLGFEPRP